MDSNSLEFPSYFGNSNCRQAGILIVAHQKALDLGFVRDLCKEYYSHTGQPSVDPIVVFKMMIVGYLKGIISERKLAEECSLNLAYRWYLGYDFDEPTPHHSVLSKARSRFGKMVFENFFNKVLQLCIEGGLVKGEKLFVDGSLVQANASVKSLTPREDALQIWASPREYVDKVFEENPLDDENPEDEEPSEEEKPSETQSTSLFQGYEGAVQHRDPPRVLQSSYRKKHKSNIDYMSSTDRESSYVYRPGKGRLFSYKDHVTVDSHGRVITAVVVTPGAVAEDHMLKELLNRQPLPVQEVCGDSRYGSAYN